MDNISRAECDEHKENCEPDDSVSVPQYEGTSPDEAAGIVKRLSKKAADRKLSPNEKNQYEACQSIADLAGILPDQINEDNCTSKK